MTISKLVDAADAVSVIRDGDVVASSGWGGHGVAECILQAIEEHMILHLTMPHSHPGPGLGEQIRCIGHAFHTTRDHHIITSCDQQVVGKHHRFHP